MRSQPKLFSDTTAETRTVPARDLAKVVAEIRQAGGHITAMQCDRSEYCITITKPTINSEKSPKLADLQRDPKTKL